MFPSHIKSRRQLDDAFPSEESCLEYLEFRRWNGKVTSPFIENGIAWKCKSGKYMCKKTRKYFTVRTGSIFEKTKIPLRDWFAAIWMMTSFKRGVSAIQLSREFGVTIKTAWFFAGKIRRLLGMEAEAEPVSGFFELDEAAFGGLNGNRHADKKVKNARAGHTPDKTWVLGIKQRNGNLRAYAIAARKPEFVQPIVRRLIAAGSVLFTDAWTGYSGLNDKYLHYVVKDGKKISRNYNKEIHTNQIEGAWGNMKRGYNGTYNWWSKKHLQFYLDEFVFRYNTRRMADGERFCLFLGNVFRRITQRDIIATTWNY